MHFYRHDDHRPGPPPDFVPGLEGAFEELSHQLQPPLSVVLGDVERLVDAEAGDLSPQQASMLRAAHSNARWLRGRIEELLDEG
jgi:K+-sensing histidine kinase KdpD